MLNKGFSLVSAAKEHIFRVMAKAKVRKLREEIPMKNGEMPYERKETVSEELTRSHKSN
jgi:hypothetical protein